MPIDNKEYPVFPLWYALLILLFTFMLFVGVLFSSYFNWLPFVSSFIDSSSGVINGGNKMLHHIGQFFVAAYYAAITAFIGRFGVPFILPDFFEPKPAEEQ